MFFPGIPGDGGPNDYVVALSANIERKASELNKYRGPVQLVRIKVDTSFWRTAIAEAERPIPALPYRVQMQTIFIDTILNGHVSACVQKRKNLTLLKHYHICDEKGVTDEAATELINNEWFQLIRNYIHDAKYYGYSLITFGNMVDGAFPNVQITRRADVSPDRLVLSSFQYIPTGINFMDPNDRDPQGNSYFDWSLYVPTPSENGVSKCGYGLLYKVALYEIIMRSLIGWNTDYVERFGQPTTIIKTAKDDEEERGKAESAAQQLASSGYMIMDKMDEFELAVPKNAGTSWQSYDNLEARCKKIISSIVLGHEDGIGSTPGKLGSGQGGQPGDVDNSPIGKALAECESADSRFEESIINNDLIPKMIKLGIKIPIGKKYKLKNDQERDIENQKEAEKAQNWANVAVALKSAGLQMSAEDYAEKTGIIVTDAPIPEPTPSFNPGLKAKLTKTYSNHARRKT